MSYFPKYTGDYTRRRLELEIELKKAQDEINEMKELEKLQEEESKYNEEQKKDIKRKEYEEKIEIEDNNKQPYLKKIKEINKRIEILYNKCTEECGYTNYCRSIYRDE